MLTMGFRFLPHVIVWIASLGFMRASAVPQGDDFFSLSLEELGQIQISTATGDSKTLDRAPAIASVVTASEIRASGATNLNQVLEAIPGLHISLSGLSRLDSIISIRGIHTGFNPHVLLLMDGVPVQYNLQGGRPILFRLPVTSIEQVEVIRGPGSAVYGADAFSGVINVITKNKIDKSYTELGGSAGSFGQRELWFAAGSKLEDWNIKLNISYQKSDGDQSRFVPADLQTVIDNGFATSASLAPGPLATNYELFDTHLSLSNTNWDVNLWNMSSETGLGIGAAQALDPTGGDDNDLYLGDVSYQTDEWIKNWQFKAGISYLQYHNRANFNIFPAGAILPIGSDGNVNFATPQWIVSFPDGLIGQPEGKANDSLIDLVAIYSGFDKHRVRLAIGAKRQSIDTAEKKNFGRRILDGTEIVVDGTLADVSDTDLVYLQDSSRSVRFISIQDEWELARNWELTAGLRYDDYSDFGSTVNPRLALVWTAHDKFTSKFLYGSAFRSPSFSEQFLRNNPVSLGNPNLDPETIDTYELSFNYRITKDAQIALNLFRYQARDMIEYRLDDNGASSTAQNIRDQEGRGFELEFNWNPLQSLRLGGNYSVQNAEDAVQKTDIAEAPGQQFTLIANWELPNQWFFNGKVNWVADRARAITDARRSIEDYTWIDLTVRKRGVFRNLDIAFAIRNASDEDAREPSNSGVIADDFPLEKRSARVELRYTFD